MSDTYFIPPTQPVDGDTAEVKDVNDISDATNAAFILLEGDLEIINEDLAIATSQSKAWAVGPGDPPDQDNEVEPGLYSSSKYAEDSSLSAAASLVSAGESSASAGEALSSETASGVSEANSANNVLLTNADVVATNADVVTTNSNVVATNDDVATTNANVLLTNADVATTNSNVLLTNADVVATNGDVVATNADVVTTNSNVLLTNADVVATSGDATQTALDRVATNEDVVTTNGYVTEATLQADRSESEADRAEAYADGTGNTPLVASSVLTNPDASLSLTTAQTLNSTTKLYTGNGTSQDVVTDIDSVDMNVAFNGCGYWLDRTVNLVHADDASFSSFPAPNTASGTDTVYVDDATKFIIGDLVGVVNTTTGEVLGSGTVTASNTASDFIRVEGMSITRTIGDVFEVRVASASGTATWSGARGLSKVHVKSRSDARDHMVTDGLRGIYYQLYTNLTLAETNYSANLEGFNTTGFNVGDGIRVNTNLATYVAYQELFTHIKWGTTGHGKFFIEAYNPITGGGMIYYIGSGLAGHEIPHSQGSKLDYFDIKRMTAVNWATYYGSNTNYLTLNETTASTVDGTFWNDDSPNSEVIYLGTSTAVNAQDEEYILYYKRKSANWTIVEYEGTGAAGNYVELGFKASRVIIKAVSHTGSWATFDNQRSNFDAMLRLEASDIELSADFIDVNDTSVAFTSSTLNESGYTYILIAEADTNADGGGSYYPRPTDGILNINGGFFNYTNGKTEKGYTLSSRTVTKSLDTTNMANGFRWISENSDGTTSDFAYEPQYQIDGFAPWFDTSSGKWYEPYNLVENGDFKTDLSSWVDLSNVEWLDGTMQTLGTANAWVYQIIDVLPYTEYQISLDTFSISGAPVRVISVGDDDSAYSATYISQGVMVDGTNIYTVTTNSSTKMGIYLFTSLSGVVNFDNVVARETDLNKREAIRAVELTPTPSFIPVPVFVTGGQVQYLGDDEVATNVMPRTAFPEGIDFTTGGWDYEDPDAIGANPTATMYPDGTIVGSTDNGSYTKWPNGDMTCRSSGLINDSEGVGDGIFTFPSQFMDQPSMSAHTGNVGTNWTVTPHRINTSSINITSSLTSSGAATTLSVGYTAIGRWK